MAPLFLIKIVFLGSEGNFLSSAASNIHSVSFWKRTSGGHPCFLALYFTLAHW
jgi:hypothetical protein